MLTKVRGGFAIKSNHGTPVPRHIISIDTETLPTQLCDGTNIKSHSFRLGSAISVRIIDDKPACEKICNSTSKDELIEFILSQTRMKQTLWVIGHNIMFDFITLGFPALFESGEISPTWPRDRRKESIKDDRKPRQGGMCCIDSPPTIIACRCGKTQGNIVFVDSMNWFPYPLSELGLAMKRPKWQMPKFHEPDSEWMPYCENDARIVLDAFCSLIAFVKEQDLGVFRYTAASQAMSAFRHKFMPHKVYYHGENSVKVLERNAYFGGRSEVFKRARIQEKMYKLDVSSLFPSCMAYNKFPYTIESYEFRPDYFDDIGVERLYNCVAECIIDTDEPIYPVRNDGITIYPIGQFATTICGPELVHAASKGHIKGIRAYSHYKVDKLFTSFVTELWRLRMKFESEDNQLYAELTKRIMNSLHGKFGQLSPIWQFTPEVIVMHPWSKWCEMNIKTGEVAAYRSFGWYAQRDFGRAEKKNNFCAISAYIASHARVRMNGLRSIAGRGNVWYQGVDSLIVTPDGYERLLAAKEIRERELGYLRIEGVTDFGEIRGVGDYTFGSKTVIAGKPSSCTHDEYGDLIQRQFLSKSRLFDEKAIDTIHEHAIKWQSNNRYRKGDVQPDGWVDPFVVSPETKVIVESVNEACVTNIADAFTNATQSPTVELEYGPVTD